MADERPWWEQAWGAVAGWGESYVDKAVHPLTSTPDWTDVFNPVALTGDVVRAADWVAMQPAGLVGAGLTALQGGDAGAALSRYEANLNAGLNFTPRPPDWQGPIGAQQVGDAIAGGIDLTAGAAGHVAERAIEGVTDVVWRVVDKGLDTVKDNLMPLALLALGAFALSRQPAPSKS